MNKLIKPITKEETVSSDREKELLNKMDDVRAKLHETFSNDENVLKLSQEFGKCLMNTTIKNSNNTILPYCCTCNISL